MRPSQTGTLEKRLRGSVRQHKGSRLRLSTGDLAARRKPSLYSKYRAALKAISGRTAMAPRATASWRWIVGGVGPVLAFATALVAGGGDTRLPTAEEVQALQKSYRAERDALVQAGAKTRFLPSLFDNAELMAARGDAALKAGRLLQATEAFRQARWQLPYQGPH